MGYIYEITFPVGTTDYGYLIKVKIGKEFFYYFKVDRKWLGSLYKNDFFSKDFKTMDNVKYAIGDNDCMMVKAFDEKDILDFLDKNNFIFNIEKRNDIEKLALYKILKKKYNFSRNYDETEVEELRDIFRALDLEKTYRIVTASINEIEFEKFDFETKNDILKILRCRMIEAKEFPKVTFYSYSGNGYIQNNIFITETYDNYRLLQCRLYPFYYYELVNKFADGEAPNAVYNYLAKKTHDVSKKNLDDFKKIKLKSGEILLAKDWVVIFKIDKNGNFVRILEEIGFSPDFLERMHSGYDVMMRNLHIKKIFEINDYKTIFFKEIRKLSPEEYKPKMEVFSSKDVELKVLIPGIEMYYLDFTGQIPHDFNFVYWTNDNPLNIKRTGILSEYLKSKTDFYYFSLISDEQRTIFLDVQNRFQRNDRGRNMIVIDKSILGFAPTLTSNTEIMTPISYKTIWEEDMFLGVVFNFIVPKNFINYYDFGGENFVS